MADTVTQGGNTGHNNGSVPNAGPTTSDGTPIVGGETSTANQPGTNSGNEGEGGENNSSQTSAIDDIFNPKVEGTDTPTPKLDTPNDSANPMEAINKLMTEMKPRGEFNEEMIAKAGQGDMEGMNKLLSDNHVGAVQDATKIMTQVLGKLIPEIQADFASKLKEAMHSDKGMSSLETALPNLMTAELKPVTELFYNKAMERTNGDFKAAIEMTRKAVGEFSTKAADEKDPSTVPSNEGNVKEQDFMDFFSR